MGSRDLLDMYTLSPQACSPWASNIHIRQIPPAHVTTYTYVTNLCLNSSRILTIFQFGLTLENDA